MLSNLFYIPTSLMFLCLLLVNHCCQFYFQSLFPWFWLNCIMYLSYFTHVSLLSCAFWSQLSHFPGGRLLAGLFQQHILFSFASEFGSLVKEVSYLPASEAWNVTCSCCNKSSLYLFMRENGGRGDRDTESTCKQMPYKQTSSWCYLNNTRQGLHAV